MIKLEDTSNKEKLRDLELAANNGQVDKKIIFDIYRQIKFDLNTLINAKNIYQTLETSDARSLIYQKFLLSEQKEKKVEYLFLLEELFQKDKILNVYSDLLSDSLKEIGLENIPDNYKEVAEKKMLVNEEAYMGKIKYNDKILHQSKILKLYIEKENNKKIKKEIEKIFKKISKNRKYFYSAKDLALVDSLLKDGFKIPNSFNYTEQSSKYEVPENLSNL